MKMKFTNRGGYTLIELLVTVSLFALIMTAALSILAVTVKNNYKAEKMMKIRRIGDSAVNMVHRQLITADAIQPPSPNQLTFTKPTEAGQVTNTVSCVTGANGTLQIQDGSGTVIYDLIKAEDNITIDQCTFEANCSATDTRTCSFTLKLNLGGDTSETFSTQTSFRNKVNVEN